MINLQKNWVTITLTLLQSGGQTLPSYVLMHLQFFRPSTGPAITPRLLFMLQLFFLKHPINLGCNCMNRKKNVMSAHFEITKKGTEVVKFSLCLDNKPLYFIFCTRRDLYYATHRWILKRYCPVTISMIWLDCVLMPCVFNKSYQV